MSQSRNVSISYLRNSFQDIEQFFNGETEASGVIPSYEDGNGFELTLFSKERSHDSIPYSFSFRAKHYSGSYKFTNYAYAPNGAITGFDEELSVSKTTIGIGLTTVLKPQRANPDLTLNTGFLLSALVDNTSRGIWRKFENGELQKIRILDDRIESSAYENPKLNHAIYVSYLLDIGYSFSIKETYSIRPFYALQINITPEFTNSMLEVWSIQHGFGFSVGK